MSHFHNGSTSNGELRHTYEKLLEAKAKMDQTQAAYDEAKAAYGRAQQENNKPSEKPE